MPKQALSPGTHPPGQVRPQSSPIFLRSLVDRHRQSIWQIMVGSFVPLTMRRGLILIEEALQYAKHEPENQITIMGGNDGILSWDCFRHPRRIVQRISCADAFRSHTFVFWPFEAGQCSCCTAGSASSPQGRSKSCHATAVPRQESRLSQTKHHLHGLCAVFTLSIDWLMSTHTPGQGRSSGAFQSQSRFRRRPILSGSSHGCHTC